MNLSSILTPEDFEKHFRNELWTDAARAVCQKHNIPVRQLTRSEHGENIVFLVDAGLVVKIYTPFKQGFRREKLGLEFARNKISLPITEILFEGEIEGFEYLIFKQNEGILMSRERWLGLNENEQIGVVSELAANLKELHSHNAQAIDFDWENFVGRQALTVFERQKASGVNAKILERLPFYLEENLKLLPEKFAPAFMHGDIHFGNLRLVEIGGRWRISALFDFADSLKGLHEYEFVAIGVLMIQGQSEIQREFFRAYGYTESEIDANLRRRLMLLTILYEHSNLRKYALRLKPEADLYTLEELEKNIWSFTEK
jgi:hygromycin-B 7''-O-kinase